VDKELKTVKTLINRRRFLAGAALGGTGLLILRNSASAWSYQANQKLSVALVGAGARGMHFVQAIPRIGENLVAVCEVNRNRATEALKNLPEVRKYQDFRKMLDEMDRQIDAVVVATPVHTHAVIAARAMKRGKHVYVEKPIAHDVAEARALRQIARQQKVVTQMGNQGMATDSFRRTLELIQDGAVGEIREVYVLFGSGGTGPLERPKVTPPVPQHLDWDLWLGPAPFRPYHPCYLNPDFPRDLTPHDLALRGWNRWRDFGARALGGAGSHSINLAFKALNLGALWDDAEAKRTIRVETEISERCLDNFSRWQTVRFDLPARGSLPPARIDWCNGWESEAKYQGIHARLEEIAGQELKWEQGSWSPHSYSLLVGGKGMVHTNFHNSVCVLLPEKDFPKAGGPPQRLPRSGSHEREWVQACKGGPTPMSSFDHSGPVMELLLLGNVACPFGGAALCPTDGRVGQPFEFDPVTCQIVDNEQADRALCPPRREGWSL
jgi:hypothetical protein